MTKIAEPIAQILSFREDIDDVVTVYFAICEVIWAAGCVVPEEWEFHASPLHEFGRGVQHLVIDPSWPEGEIAQAWIDGQLAYLDLLYAGNVVMRYLKLVHAIENAVAS